MAGRAEREVLGSGFHTRINKVLCFVSLLCVAYKIRCLPVFLVSFLTGPHICCKKELQFFPCAIFPHSYHLCLCALSAWKSPLSSFVPQIIHSHISWLNPTLKHMYMPPSPGSFPRELPFLSSKCP